MSKKWWDHIEFGEKLKRLEKQIHDKLTVGKVRTFRGMEQCKICKKYIGMVTYFCDGHTWHGVDVHHIMEHGIKPDKGFIEFVEDNIITTNSE